jgi:hypothetical protein
MKKLKLLASIFLTVTIIVIIVINNRTPFFQTKGGPWSIGFGFTEKSFENLNVLKSAKMFSYLDMKELDLNTNFIADPFFIKEKDTFYIFFEHQKKQPNAVVSLITSVDGLNYSYRGTVLKEKFHLSYPQVFKYKNDFFMIPETKRANSILLYKSHNFPFNWKIHDTLVKNVRLKDPSIYLSDSLNVIVASDDNMNMFMYSADSLFSNWKLHMKPVVSFGTESRPGGRFFIQNNKLHLPIQNSTHGYGYGVSIYEFNFDKHHNYTIKKVKPLFLKSIDSIEELSHGMHHFDIQEIDGNKKYYVFDGNSILNKEKFLNIRGPIKWNYLDLKNWFYK